MALADAQERQDLLVLLSIAQLYFKKRDDKGDIKPATTFVSLPVLVISSYQVD